jgi:signal transduction histidine kinase
MKCDAGTRLACFCKGRVLRTLQHGGDRLIMLHCSDKASSISTFVTLKEKIEGLQREIAQRRHAEAVIAQLNQELEQRVAERTRQLEHANHNLQKSLSDLKMAQDHLVRSERMAALGDMVAGVAHEINTPVGVGVTAASFLERQVNRYASRYQEGTLQRAEVEKFLGVVADSAGIILANLQRAGDLVRSFKQIAVDQTSDEIRRVNMKEAIQDLLKSLNPVLRKTAHTVTYACPEDVDLDSYPGAITQILNNLISNSLSHAFEDMAQGAIHIDVTHDRDWVRIHYSDNGIGIPKRNLARIFEPFFTTKRNAGGSGLGMNIVYNLVTDKLGGEIHAASEERQGVHFYINLPIATVTKDESPRRSDAR